MYRWLRTRLHHFVIGNIMSQKTIYTCNVCKDERDVEDLRGVHFTTQGRFEERNPKETHTHICKWCVALIQTWPEKLTAVAQ